MPERSRTQIGRVRQVLGATVTIELDRDLAGVAPIYRGRLQQVGQIGSLVRVPQGLVDLVGTVSLVGIAELAGPVVPTEALHGGERWLQVQLLGEVDRGTGRFQRGVGSYPGLDDPVHFTTPDQLASVSRPPARSVCDSAALPPPRRSRCASTPAAWSRVTPPSSAPPARARPRRWPRCCRASPAADGAQRTSS